MRIDKDGVVHFDTGGGDFSGFGDGSSQGGGYNGGDYSSPGEADQTAVNTALMDMALASAPNFDPAGVAGLSGVPGQTVQGALGQMLFDLALQQDTTSAAGMKDARSTLDSLANLGFGRVEGLNPNNPTQSVEEMLAAQNIQSILNYTVPALVSMVPGYGTVSALGKGIANIHGLMTGRLTPAEVMPGLAAGLIGAKTGIPSNFLEGLFEGNLGKAAGAGAQAGLGALASNFGPFGSLAYNLSGMSSAVNKGVSEAVSGATGGGRSAGLGALPGASSAPSSSTTPIGSSSGDLGITQEVSPTRAAIEQAVQQSVTPSLDRQILAGRYVPIMQYEYGA